MSMLTASVSLARAQGKAHWVTPTLVLALGAIIWALGLNRVDVTWPVARVGHVLLASLVLFAPLVAQFLRWRSRRASDAKGVAARLKSAVNASAFVVIQSIAVLIAIECLARAFPLFDTMGGNPGLKHLWPAAGVTPPSPAALWPAQDPSAGPRVLILGDSFTLGAGIPGEERFAVHLQQRLRQRHPDAQVFTEANCGINTEDEANRLERVGDSIRPDIVVVGYVLNDAHYDSLPPAAPVANPVAVATSPAKSSATKDCCVSRWCAATKSARLRGLYWLAGRMNSYAAYWALQHNYPTGVRLAAAGWRAQHREGSASWSRTEKALDRIAAWCDRRGARKMLVVFPLFDEGAEEDRPVLDQVVAAASRRGFEARSALDDFGGRWSEMWLSRYDSHPGPAAHRVIADQMADFIFAGASNANAPLNSQAGANPQGRLR